MGRVRRLYDVDYDLRKLYNITLEEYNTMLHSQECKCSICGASVDEQDKSLSVDHCHTTGKVRGLLCAKCNMGIGLFNDNKEVITKAIQYLKRNWYE